MMWAIPAPDPGVEIVVASHGMSKGVSQTEGPQLVARASLQFGDAQFGGQWKNLSSNDAAGEASAFAILSHKFGGLQLNAGVTYKTLTGAPSGIDADCIELSAGGSQKVGPVSIRLNAIYSPDDIGSSRRSLYVEGGPSIDVGKTLRLSANLGHRWRENGPAYTSMNAGAAYTVFKGFAVDARYFRTNRTELGEVFRNRLVVSGRWSF